MSFNKSVQKIFYILAISISAILLCFVGVWATVQMNLNFQGKISPDILCIITANDNEIFDNYNTSTTGNPTTNGNTLSTSVTLTGNVTTAVTFKITNYTAGKYIRLSVADISGATIENNAVAVCANTSGANSSMTIHIAGSSNSNAVIALNVEEVYMVTVSGTGLGVGEGPHYFAPDEACEIAIAPQVGYQLPTSITVGGVENTSYTHTNTGATISAQSILKGNATILANCNQIFDIKKSTAESLVTPNQNNNNATFTIEDDTTYFPNNGHYTYNNGSTTQGTLKSTFVEYPYYVEMGMYPQTQTDDVPALSETPFSTEVKTVTTTVATTIENEETTRVTTITTTNTNPQSTSSVSSQATTTKQAGDTEGTETTSQIKTTTTYHNTSDGTEQYAKIVIYDEITKQTTSTTYYKFEPIKWIVVGTQDGTPLSSLYYNNNMLYTDGACGKQYTGQLVLMSAYILDSSIFNQDTTLRQFSSSTIGSTLWNRFSVINTSSTGVQMNTIPGQYASTKQLISQAYSDAIANDTATNKNLTFFLLGGQGSFTLTESNSVTENYYAGTYFDVTGIKEGKNQKTYNIGVTSSTAYALAKGVEENTLTTLSGAESATASRGWVLANDNTNTSTSAYWTRSGMESNGALAINMNAIPKNVLSTNSNVGIRPMMVLDLGFYANDTYQ